MTLTIFCVDGSKQRINLHPSFTLEVNKRGETKRLTETEIHDKAYKTAVSIVPYNYKYHSLINVKETVREAMNLKH